MRFSKELIPSSDGSLLALLTALLYCLFTLLPTSQSLMVSWPWVFVWQVCVGLPILWLLWQLWFKPLTRFRLGRGLDWPMGLLVIGLLVSSTFAEFPNQARWYAWAALGGVAALYALSGWLTTPLRCRTLLQFQGGLGLGFILLSLGLWWFQIYQPELIRLESLQQFGVFQTFNFRTMSLRNWQPLGHQNYVAGYLVLMIPLLLGLAWVEKGWQRWCWGIGGCLGLVDLYTTSSRGGTLALIGTVAISLPIFIWRSRLPRRLTIPLGLLLFIGSMGTALANNRVRGLLAALLQGRTSNSELAYRLITNTIGWRIGLAHPLTGAGPGSIPLVYQKYRPYWAGQEAELHFQLHSTPAQLWAEFGVWGIAALIGLILFLVWMAVGLLNQKHPVRDAVRDAEAGLEQQTDGVNLSSYQDFKPSPIILWSILAGLFAYGLMSLTDYQLDNISISGVLVVYLVVIAKTNNDGSPTVIENLRQDKDSARQGMRRMHRALSIFILGCFMAMSLWLVPIHKAWALSKQGFNQLNQGDFDAYVQALQKSHRLAPWEPYYPSMLAWTLGDFSLQKTEAASALRRDAVEWFQTANAISPYQEFGYSNLGWLLIREDPVRAIDAFIRSTQLVPNKQGVFFGLGYALLLNNQIEQAIDAFVLELLQFPRLITSPVWQIGQFATVQDAVFDKLLDRYQSLLQEATNNPGLTRYILSLRGALFWWQGNLTAAAQDWQSANSALGQVMIQLAQDTTLTIETLPESVAHNLVIQAWIMPDQRQVLLQKAWLQAQTELPQLRDEDLFRKSVDRLVLSMNQSNSVDQWLKTNAPIQDPRNRRLGFGSLSRHIDGPSPIDYYPRFINQPIELFFSRLFPSPRLSDEWDSLLQPIRETLYGSLK